MVQIKKLSYKILLNISIKSVSSVEFLIQCVLTEKITIFDSKIIS